MPRINTLFICARNQWRSPTAERVFLDDWRLAVRSCGVSQCARRKLFSADLTWADVVFVMESEHRKRVIAQFRSALDDTPIHVLNIPDEFQFMAPELVDLLVERVGEYFAAE
ncbi:MAG: phosphotyrosine protein phosphatase [Planctomycetota bacterium]|nr:phosphotyrosine protein phosphatase [Planctomycetota bacterium]